MDCEVTNLFTYDFKVRHPRRVSNKSNYKVCVYIVKHNYVLGGMVFTICKAQLHVSATNVGHLQVVQPEDGQHLWPKHVAVCGNKMPTTCSRGFYCRSYCLLNMFRAPLCPSSGAQEYYTVVAACGISCCGFQVAGLVWS